MAEKKADKKLNEKPLKEQCILAIDDVHAFVRQYVALRTGCGDYAAQGIILSPDELNQIKDFAYMLVDLVNDSK